MMGDSGSIRFGAFRLAGPHGPLTRDSREIRLGPKATSLLWVLAGKANQIVPRDALFDAVWGNAVVGEDALDYQVRTLRKALGDNARKPRYIATVHGVGFRFIADVGTAGELPATRSDHATPPLLLAGRARELQRLARTLAGAREGRRQTVFLTGEAGIGKTALAQAFTETTESQNDDVWVATGQCLRQTSDGEALFPLLQALGQLCRGDDGVAVLNILRRWAPTALVRLRPWLSEEEYAELRRATAGTTQQRVRREMVEALEALAEQRALVLWLEDLHWSDSSTVEVVSMLAQRHYPARLVLLCSYRSTDVTRENHPILAVKRELVGRKDAVELPLSNLDLDAVQMYLERRFERCPDPTLGFAQLARLVHSSCNGHPLFMVHTVEHIASHMGRGDTEAAWWDMPAGLRDLIDQQLDSLTQTEQAVITAGAVAGPEFSAADVAAAMETDVESVTTHCYRLARHGQFIEPHGLTVWPDGTLSARFRFRHTLHVEGVLRRAPAAGLARQYLLVAQRREKAYGHRAEDISVELAWLYGQAGAPAEEIQHRIAAGRKALENAAGREALYHAETGLSRLELLPLPEVRDRIEMMLLIITVSALILTEGFAAARVQRTLQRMKMLSATVTDPTLRSYALSYEWASHHFRARLPAAVEIADQLTELGERLPDAKVHCLGLSRAGASLSVLGRHREAEERIRKALDIANSVNTRTWSDDGRAGPDLIALWSLSHTRWILGYPEQSLRYAGDAMARAEAVGVPLALCATVSMGTIPTQLYRRDPQALLDTCDSAISLCHRHGYTEGLSWARKYRAVAQCMLGNLDDGLVELKQSLEEDDSTVAKHMLPVDLCQLAEYNIVAGNLADAQHALESAFTAAQRNGHHSWEPELWRVQANFHLAADQGGEASSQAEKCLDRAIAIARDQEARSLELRATISLTRLWSDQGREGACDLLEPVYCEFTEGFDAPDVRQAKRLLESVE